MGAAETPAAVVQRTVVSTAEFQEQVIQTNAAGPRIVKSLELRKVNLKSIKLPDEIDGLTFESCDFSESDMTKLRFGGVIFDNCIFQQTIFDGANLIGAKFINNCVLHGAYMRVVEEERADFQRAHFCGADLRTIDATAANFQEADFAGSKLSEAIFILADLRNATNLLLDQTKTRDAQFSKTNEDPWSRLRRVYTSFGLLLNLLPVTIFVATLAIKAYGLYLVGTLQGIVLGPETIATYCQQSGKTCEPSTILGIVSGYHEGILALGFVIFATAYNTLRLLLTMVVSGLRENEDRTGVSPPYIIEPSWKSWYTHGSYRLPHKADKVLRVLRWAMLALFISNLYRIMFAEVTLIH